MTDDDISNVERKARDLLAPFGLRNFGQFDADGSTGLLIGNIGSELWPEFSKSPEFQDGQTHALDRWTARVLIPISNQLGAEVRFPFGEKIWPFQQYAKAATGMKQSPIGLLIHSEFGLWIAFRGALILNIPFTRAERVHAVHPCDTCIEKLCTTTCPIGAFTDDGYDCVSCKSYVRSEDGKACLAGGCRSRHSCPVGQEHIYNADHQAFHMRAFV